MKHYLPKFLAAALTLLLGAMLIATIYFTLFELEWIAFLAGALFAAVAATASQASESQWLVMRRTRQLQRVTGVLADEAARHERTAEALRVAESHLHLIGDALPVMIVFVDREERCRYHNRAFAQWRGRSREQIEGEVLREVLGNEIYEEFNLRRAGGIRRQGNPLYSPVAALRRGNRKLCVHAAAVSAGRGAPQRVLCADHEQPAITPRCERSWPRCGRSAAASRSMLSAVPRCRLRRSYRPGQPRENPDDCERIAQDGYANHS